MFFMASFWRKSAFTESGCICNFWHLEYKKKLGVETQEESEGELKKNYHDCKEEDCFLFSRSASLMGFRTGCRSLN